MSGAKSWWLFVEFTYIGPMFQVIKILTREWLPGVTYATLFFYLPHEPRNYHKRSTKQRDRRN